MHANLQDNTIDDASLVSTVSLDVAPQFVDAIDSLYRAAISNNPSPRNRIAYGCYLAEHQQYIKGMREFGKLLEIEEVAGNAAMLSDIVRHISRIEARLEEDDTIGRSELASIDSWQDWNEELVWNVDGPDQHQVTESKCAAKVSDFIRQLMGESPDSQLNNCRDDLAGLDSQILHEVTGLLNMLWADRMACEQRRTGLTLLKLALCCGRHHRCEIEVACVRKAIQCFEQAATEIRASRIRAQARAVAAN